MSLTALLSPSISSFRVFLTISACVSSILQTVSIFLTLSESMASAFVVILPVTFEYAFNAAEPVPSSKLPATIAASPDEPIYGATDCIKPPRPEITPATGSMKFCPKFVPVVTALVRYEPAVSPAISDAETA